MKDLIALYEKWGLVFDAKVWLQDPAKEVERLAFAARAQAFDQLNYGLSQLLDHCQKLATQDRRAAGMATPIVRPN